MSYNCKLCNKSFSTPGALGGHMNSHTGQNYRKHKLGRQKWQEENLKRKKEDYNKNPILCKTCFLPIPFKKRNANKFCSSSCSATYNNKHKKHGTRRSKLEKWIEERLKNEFFNLEIQFNSKGAIESELDIYIPSLRLAFEINGIFHYEPIYSTEQFDRIQNNDQQKLIECYKRGIELCIIDISQQKRVTEKTSQKYYQIIKDLIIQNKNRK